MPRKLTTNAAAARKRRGAYGVDDSFRVARGYMSPSDMALLAEILDRYVENTRQPGELLLASAFETSIALHREDLLVVDADEYNRLLKRLEELEAFRKKVAVMPARDAA